MINITLSKVLHFLFTFLIETYLHQSTSMSLNNTLTKCQKTRLLLSHELQSFKETGLKFIEYAISCRALPGVLTA